MGYNARNDEIRDNIERMRRDRDCSAVAVQTALESECSRPVSIRHHYYQRRAVIRARTREQAVVNFKARWVGTALGSR